MNLSHLSNRSLRRAIACLALIACEPVSNDSPDGPVLFSGDGAGELSAAERALKGAGFNKVQLGGMPLFQCGEDDSLLASHEFTAIGPTGQRVSGAVCCGLIFKGCTVRF